jgi:stage V sporulation protein T
MKSTGIVRRIDDLGRIVIPKETRKSLNIRPGDPLQLFLDGDMIIFQKHSPFGQYLHLVTEYAAVLSDAINLQVLITDKESVIASSLPSKLEARISDGLLQAINLGVVTEEIQPLSDGEDIAEHIEIIKAEESGIGIGAIIITGSKAVDNGTKTAARVAASYLGKFINY